MLCVLTPCQCVCVCVKLGMMFSLQNIDFMPTILSRFDMIFIIKDEHNVAKDTVSIACTNSQPPALVGSTCTVHVRDQNLIAICHF